MLSNHLLGTCPGRFFLSKLYGGSEKDLTHPYNLGKEGICAMKKFTIAAGLALLLIGGGFAYSTPTSYLSVDINPSLEMAVNALDRVVDVQAFNEDGAAVLAGVDLDGLEVDEAVSLIVDEAAEQGYIEEDGSSVVSLTASTDDQDQADELIQAAEEGALEAMEENEVVAEVTQAVITHERRAAAIAAGISPGKMNLIQKLLEAQAQNTAEAGTELNSETEAITAGDSQTDWTEASVKDIMKAIKATRAGSDLEAAEADSTGEDAVKTGKGKANAPGQQLKAGTGEADDEDLILLDGKAKKKAPVDSEDEAVEEVESE